MNNRWRNSLCLKSTLRCVRVALIALSSVPRKFLSLDMSAITTDISSPLSLTSHHAFPVQCVQLSAPKALLRY